MPVYSQSLALYSLSNGPRGWRKLPALYQLARKAPGCLLRYTCTAAPPKPGDPGSPVGLSITIPSPSGLTAAEMFGARGQFSDYDAFHQSAQIALANRIFDRQGTTILIESDDYSVYSRGSETIERNRTRWKQHVLYASDDEAVTPP
jgi:hypothetical protein